MKNIEIIVGSQMGASEYTADQLQATLEEQGYTATVHEQPVFADIPHRDSIWVICTSTHGAGDLPDNILGFYDDLMTSQQDFSSLQFSVIGLGDSSYDTFCQAGKTLDEALKKKGAQRMTELLQIDVLEYPLPEEQALEWLEEWVLLLK